MQKDIQAQFQQSSKELLDMGLRGNTLLSFNKSAKTLDIVDEKSTQVFDLLVEKKKAMNFLPIPSDLDDEDADDSTGLTLKALQTHLEESKGGDRHLDASLQTQLTTRQLEQQLIRLNADALTFIQEQGVDLLYLATGFIKWHESDVSDKPRYAPLVLIPVEMTRNAAGESFKINFTDAELGPNLTLAAKLKSEFGIILPTFEVDEEFTLEGYFEQVSQAIKTEPRWALEPNKIAMGFFSFGKFQMYQDLSDDAWPEGKKPHQHSVISKLFGDGFEVDRTELAGADMDVNTVEKLHLVLDSDSSQTEAVLAAKAGSNLVIQGPPGTGKSQTITNIISQALADNKKVLFVAEKMAALEVVKRRLDNCHLGDAVLELHSHKANKKSVLAALESSLLQDEPLSPSRHEDIHKLTELRAKLDQYCEAANTSILGSDKSYVTALGESLKFERLTLGIDAQPLPMATQWNAREYNQALGKIQELVTHLDEHQAPNNNCFSTTSLDDFSPVLQKQVNSTLIKAIAETDKLIAETLQITSMLSLTTPEVLADCYAVIAQTITMIEKPDFGDIDCSKALWLKHGDKLVELITQGIELDKQKQILAETFIDAAFDFDWLSVRSGLVNYGSKWWRFCSGNYRSAKASLAGMMKQGLQGNATDWLSQVDALLAYKSACQRFNEQNTLLVTSVGSDWQGSQTDWQHVQTAALWLQQCYLSIPAKQQEQAQDGSDVWESYVTQPLPAEFDQAFVVRITQLQTDITALLNELATQLHIESPLLITRLQLTLIDQMVADDTHAWTIDLDDVYALTRFNRLKAECLGLELEDWALSAAGWQHEPMLLKQQFELSYYRELINYAYSNIDEIRYFDRVAHEKVIEEYKLVDSQLFTFSQEALVRRLFDNQPDATAKGEVEILRREFNKKRRQLPLRRLLIQAGRAVQQIKPVFMMSPMSVATYLQPGVVEFDLVVFDEASQVKVADALGAILRAKQVIVVGDTKQMPPTDFFGKQLEIDDEEAENSVTADMESILGMFLSAGTPERMLKWHYRSRHESLIAVSNQEFYNNQLLIFPSPGINPMAKGLSFNHDPSSSYDKGNSRTNLVEAQTVAKAVMLHAQTKPSMTLGVVAFSIAQSNAILFEVERLRKEQPELEHFFANRDDGEHFFVKNLENVQGDERDTIFISIGYGRTAEGRLGLSFGPLNRDGGERRLNVLISRARMAMEVFANFTATDMGTSDASPFGVRALKHFLQYAETGVLVKQEETGKAPDSPFEEEVIYAIQQLGYKVEPQVGCAGFYIDIAVRDPNNPGRYMLAVECDGATYHSSRSARDRDRIRQNVLEGLGWRFHRIWSTDWFRNAHKETQRLDDCIKASIAFYQALDAQPADSAIVVNHSNVVEKAAIERVAVERTNHQVNYTCCALTTLNLTVNHTIPEVSTSVLAQDIASIVNVESPIHIKQVGQRLLSAVGSTRSGAKINRSILAATQMLVGRGEVSLDGDYLLSSTHSKQTASNLLTFTVRHRGELPNSERKLDLIHDDEIKAAIRTVVEGAYSILAQDTMASAIDLLGFGNLSAQMKQRLTQLVDEMVQDNVLSSRGDVLSLEA
ncbi:DUF3320 domain-containing protein [Moritella sp. Urea-trap-13]|uniref:DUF3320 domain-containing protein n=1 Tax=Moritella sp. Urea-trap-13 TaxID=2058327 RepID=UPI000C321B41|nr:DUF3320 domain-containing protein [Moritella sp. Urea-trap-13]PKH07035.1 DUF3320 domain-containing protein [Moritella sp. Urea-trap-13]